MKVVSKVIGYLVTSPDGKGHIVLCDECNDSYSRTTVHEENILPYDQSCHRCKKMLVTGTFGVELFD